MATHSPPPALRNTGVTCFLNGATQLLRVLLMGVRARTTRSEVLRCLRALDATSGVICNPLATSHIFMTSPLRAGQQDAADVLNLLLEDLVQDISHAPWVFAHVTRTRGCCEHVNAVASNDHVLYVMRQESHIRMTIKHVMHTEITYQPICPSNASVRAIRRALAPMVQLHHNFVLGVEIDNCIAFVLKELDVVTDYIAHSLVCLTAKGQGTLAITMTIICGDQHTYALVFADAAHPPSPKAAAEAGVFGGAVVDAVDLVDGTDVVAYNADTALPPANHHHLLVRTSHLPPVTYNDHPALLDNRETWEEMLSAVFDPCLLDGENRWACETCGEVTATSIISLDHAPLYIIAVVSMPGLLNAVMPAHGVKLTLPCAISFSAIVKEASVPLRYTCQALIQHEWLGVGMGHYRAFVLQGGVLYECNDASVRHVDGSFVCQPYCMLLRRDA